MPTSYSRMLSMILVWLRLLRNKLPKNQFILLLSVSVGVIAGLAAVVLKTLVHTIFKVATQHDFSDSYYLLLLLPMLGIGLTYFIIQRVLGGKLSKGLGPLHYTIAKKNSDLPLEQTYAQLITSPVTVGLGGSAGLEAPIVITGAALGSNIAKFVGLSYSERTLLLACGVAAGIASAFNAPIAGVLFTIEVLMLEVSTTGFVPLLIASASGAIVSKVILQEGTILSFQLQQPFDYRNVPFYVILGGLAGLMSVLHSKMFVAFEKHFKSFSRWPYFRMIYAGIILALLILCFPSLFGEGYSSIKSLSLQHPAELFKNSFLSNYIQNEWLLLVLVALAMFLKPIATAATLGGGGNGGNFAPTLFVGSYLGFSFAKLMEKLHFQNIPVSNFTIVGMAGLLSGIYHAPLTGIFLIAELTGGYSLMIPLMIVASISFFVSKAIEPHSMDVKDLAEAGKALSADKDTNILINMRVEELLENDFQSISADASMSTLIEAIISSERNIFPVLAGNGTFLGVVLLNDVKNIIFDKESYLHLKVRDVVKAAPDIIDLSDDMQTVVAKFEHTQAWNLPVVDKGLYVGFVSKSKLFSSYRKELIKKTIG